MAQFNPHFLVISLGNTGRYFETLHSAGHFALLSLQKAIVCGPSPESQPPFAPQQLGKQKCKGSSGNKYTLLQSPTLMNVSGRFVANAWADALKSNKELQQPRDMCLVVVHDDLEEDFGAVGVRKWKASHRGHNGIKSINSALNMNSFPGARWSRIWVGIDRPESRREDVVSNYVLSRLSAHQKGIIDSQVGLKVLACLEQLEMNWRSDFEAQKSMPAPPPKVQAKPKSKPKPQSAV
ncbi:hypothetical protein MGN70_002579 [Eutypa lata]|uniref:peptidyl-tRNA hydrolase n=1 Tax=Eutypa lata (strain UCR-EL1) TaxID=1287681 RepID=M7TC36_EUTLA|nr:putative peptidyl-trna hydrolase protein [Eutypa lata UCREL1]KAI1255839.1 hypothetical protein MGN70_002579 [Eutypa lata]